MILVKVRNQLFVCDWAQKGKCLVTPFGEVVKVTKVHKRRKYAVAETALDEKDRPMQPEDAPRGTLPAFQFAEARD